MGQSHGSRRRIFVAMLATATACAVRSEPAPSAITSAATPASAQWTTFPALSASWSKTADLVSDPMTRQKVDALVARSSQRSYVIDGITTWPIKVESRRSGVDGVGGAEWKAFQDLTSSISAADARSLLHHESPAIRVYFAEYVSRTMQNEAPDLLYPLFGDATEVEMRDGCSGRGDSVADLALGELLLDQADVNVGREKFFELVISDTRLKPKTRGLALSHLASIDRETGRRLALVAATDSDADWKREGVRALGLFANAADLSIVGGETQSPNPESRLEAATLLGKIDSPASRDLLFPLLEDSDHYVKYAAVYGYASQTTANLVVVNMLIADPDQAIAENARQAFDSRSPRELH